MNKTEMSIEDFLLDLYHHTEQSFSIRFCDHIGELIIQLNEPGDLSLNYFSQTHNLTVVEKELIQGLEKNQFQEFLEKRFSKLIESHSFSLIDGNWEYFLPTEEAMIKNVLQQ